MVAAKRITEARVLLLLLLLFMLRVCPLVFLLLGLQHALIQSFVDHWAKQKCQAQIAQIGCRRAPPLAAPLPLLVCSA